MYPAVFGSFPGPPDFARLVQDRLSRTQRQFRACRPSTLSEIRAVVDELSTISKACTAVLEDIETREERGGVDAAFKEMEAAVDWAEFLRHVQAERNPTEHELLFHAHRNTTSNHVSQYDLPTRSVLFNNRFCKGYTVRTLVMALEGRLNKATRERETGVKTDTIFTSMSLDFEWALHTTKDKYVNNDWDERACLVIFDMRRLRETPNVALFRVSDVVRFLEVQNLTNRIDAPWASNCDDCVSISMTSAARNAIVRIVPWTDLQCMPIIHHDLIRTYTLGNYREWKDERFYSKRAKADACKMVLESAKVLAGCDTSKIESICKIVQLIVKPGISFWCIKTEASREEIAALCRKILDLEAMEAMSRLSLDK